MRFPRFHGWDVAFVVGLPVANTAISNWVSVVEIGHRVDFAFFVPLSVFWLQFLSFLAFGLNLSNFLFLKISEVSFLALFLHSVPLFALLFYFETDFAVRPKNWDDPNQTNWNQTAKHANQNSENWADHKPNVLLTDSSFFRINDHLFFEFLERILDVNRIDSVLNNRRVCRIGSIRLVSSNISRVLKNINQGPIWQWSRCVHDFGSRRVRFRWRLVIGVSWVCDHFNTRLYCWIGLRGIGWGRFSVRHSRVVLDVWDIGNSWLSQTFPGNGLEPKGEHEIARWSCGGKENQI